ncbi:MAG TPA: hypothetical protein VFY67_12010 [Pyrinomonadaceae bacterium]|nr:hypothetical protein [Pyrinomonadaceae bacterium]
MASGLKLRVLKNLNGADLPGNGVIANVYALDPENAEATKRNIVIPVGFVDYKQVDLSPGEYLVEAVLPSGDILSKEATAKADTWIEVDLEAENSAHEWQGVHNLLGHVESEEPYNRVRSMENLEVSRRAAPRFGVWQIRTLPPQLNDEGPDGHRMWQTLADWIEAGPSQFFNDLKLSLRSSSPKAQDSSTELHSFFMDARGLPREHLPRWYSLVTGSKQMKLLSLPIPWFNLKTEEELPVEVLVQESNDGDLTASFSISDTDLCTALGYMSRGALRAAAQLVDQAEAVDMLFQKFTNPLGAAGGAYILLGTEPVTQRRPWHDWVQNLMNYFPWLPDGAIQYAWLQLRQSPSKENRDRARQALITAFRRGVPYYTLGLQWMVDGLTLLGEDDQEAQRMLQAVQQISWRSDTSQTFTSIALAR